MIRVYAIDEVRDFLRLLPFNIKLTKKDADLYIVDEKNFKYKEGKFYILIVDNKKALKKYLKYDNLDILIRPFSFEEFFFRFRTFYFLIKKSKKIKKQYSLLLRESKNRLILDIINTLAHKVRQPLQVINLIITSLVFKNFEVSKEELKNSFETILKSNKEISEIFDEFFRFFDFNMNIKEFNLSKVLKKLNIDVKIKEDIKILCDEERIFKVFQFLVEFAEVEEIEVKNSMLKLKVKKNIDFFIKSGDNIKIFIIKKIIEECLNAKIFQQNSHIFIKIVGGGEI